MPVPNRRFKITKTHLSFIRSMFIAAVTVAMCLTFSSCKKRISPVKGIYYWRSTFVLSPAEKGVLDTLQIKRLYVKYFELANGGPGGLYPNAVLRWIDSVPGNFEIVPVVFIPNSALLSVPAESIPGYAKKICRQVKLLHPDYAKPFKEIQVDCDWTDKTRVTFFSLIESMKQICLKQNVLLSVTLRLHQIKYRAKTGVPPANRTTLMFYNMGRLDTSDAHISILDLQQSEKYIHYLKSYPLPVDVALPVFGWGVQMRAGKAVGVLHNFSRPDAVALPYLKPAGDGIYCCDSNLFYHGLYLKQGDLVKTEEPSYDDIMAAEKMLKHILPHQQRSLILFDLDPDLTKHYNAQKLQSIYTGLN